MAVAVPILPLRFLGIPGPDFPDVSQVVTTSRNWLSRVAGRMDVHELTVPPTTGGSPMHSSSTPAQQVELLAAAAQDLNQEIETAPSDPSLHNRLGLVYFSLGDIDRACQHFQKAIALSRLGIAALGEKISSLRTGGHDKEASLALVDASQLNVELSAAHSNLARLYEKRGEHDKVIAELDMLNKEGVLFDNAAASAGAAPPAPTLDGGVARQLAQAEALLQARQIPAAAAAYRSILAQDPNVAMAHHRLGNILLAGNNPALAVDELETASKLDPGSPEALADLGLAYQVMGLNLQATKSYERALALEPRLTDAAINLSNIYSGCGRTHDAVAVLSQAVRTNPSSAKAHNNLGTLFELDGKYGPALYEFQKAVALAPGMASAHYGLATVLMQTHGYTQAIQEFKQALALQPSLTQAQDKIAEAYRKLGMTVGSAQAVN